MYYVVLIIVVLLIALLTIVFTLRNEITSYFNSEYRKESHNSLLKSIYNTGIRGEFLTFVELEKTKDPKKIVTNPYLKKKNGDTSEIDLILINTSGIYVIESKNYSGSIYGKDSDFKWTVVLGKRKFKQYNPVKQNQTHVNTLKKSQILPNDVPIYSIIVFSDRCKLKIQSTIPVIHRKDLVQEINELHKIHGLFLKPDQVENIYNQLKKYTNVDKKIKQQHIEKIKEKL